jgi:hypothetical protein
MRVLYKESAVALSAVQGEIDSAYGLSNMQDEYPRHAFISNSAIETINVSWLNTPDTIFLGHVMAEEIVFNFSTGDVVTIPNRINWHRVYARGRKKLADDVFIDIPTGATSCAIDLKNTMNVADGIDSFLSNGTNGYLTSSGMPALYKNFPQLRVGTTLINGIGNYQVRELRGIGSGGDDIKLTAGGSAGFTVNEMRLPVSVGILRVGYRRTFPNPTVGLVMQTNDFGLRQDISGSQTYAARTTARSYSVPMTLTNDHKDLWMETWEGLRGTPVATDLLNGMDSKLIGWMTCQNIPELTAESRRYNYFQTSFEIREVG